MPAALSGLPTGPRPGRIEGPEILVKLGHGPRGVAGAEDRERAPEPHLVLEVAPDSELEHLAVKGMRLPVVRLRRAGIRGIGVRGQRVGDLEDPPGDLVLAVRPEKTLGGHLVDLRRLLEAPELHERRGLQELDLVEPPAPVVGDEEGLDGAQRVLGSTLANHVLDGEVGLLGRRRRRLGLAEGDDRREQEDDDGGDVSSEHERPPRIGTFHPGLGRSRAPRVPGSVPRAYRGIRGAFVKGR
jgi:hypothetical protein